MIGFKTCTGERAWVSPVLETFALVVGSAAEVDDEADEEEAEEPERKEPPRRKGPPARKGDDEEADEEEAEEEQAEEPEQPEGRADLGGAHPVDVERLDLRDDVGAVADLVLRRLLVTQVHDAHATRASRRETRP